MKVKTGKTPHGQDIYDGHWRSTFFEHFSDGVLVEFYEGTDQFGRGLIAATNFYFNQFKQYDLALEHSHNWKNRKLDFENKYTSKSKMILGAHPC